MVSTTYWRSLCACLLLYLNAALYGEGHEVQESSNKADLQPPFLKEFFPFLDKSDKEDEIQHSLAETKRRRRVSHHGNLKRNSHMIRFMPANEIKYLQLPKKALNLTSISKYAPEKEKRCALYANVLHINNFRHKRAYKGNLTRANSPTNFTTVKLKNMAKPQKQMLFNLTKIKATDGKFPFTLTTSRENTTAAAPSSVSVSKKCSKGYMYKHNHLKPETLHNLDINKRSSTLIEAESKAIALLKQNSATTVVPHSRALPVFKRELANERLQKEDGNKEFAKREHQSHHKPKKSCKTIITKILIVPVEKQIEVEGSEDDAEIEHEIMKYAKKSFKGHSTKRTRSTTKGSTRSSVASRSSESSSESSTDYTKSSKETTSKSSRMITTSTELSSTHHEKTDLNVDRSKGTLSFDSKKTTLGNLTSSASSERAHETTVSCSDNLSSQSTHQLTTTEENSDRRKKSMHLENKTIRPLRQNKTKNYHN